MQADVRDLDDATTLALLEDALTRRRQAEVDDVRLVLHFADLHSAIPAETTPGGETLGDLGGDGTPGVGDLAVVELGIARQVHSHAARSVVADALDLRHRLPQVWAVVQRLDADVWVARKVARLSRRLSYDAVALVDSAVAAVLAGQSPARVLETAEAKVIEADIAAHDARVEAERRRRYVGLTRLDDNGHRTLIGRLEAGAAAAVMAKVQEVADLLEARGLYPDHGADELRAEALGWLARPDDLDAMATGEERSPTRRRSTVLYVHLSEAVIAGLPGVARVEGLGPHTLAQVRRLLGHDQVVLKPVIDLNDTVTTTAYEHSEALKERLHLRYGGDSFPHATATGRRLDCDHITAYDPTGPPGQTSDATSQPLSRTAHRAKTHLGYTCRRLEGGEILWRSPHGLHRLVDHAGTHVLDPTEVAAWTSDDSLDRALTRLVHRARVSTATPV